VRQVAVDVRVIELEVVEDGCARPVMNELGALVEERRIVFVGFDDEERRFAQACRDTEVLRHAADQETRRAAGAFEWLADSAAKD